MSLGHLYQFTMEKTATNTTPSFTQSSELIDINSFVKFFSSSWSFLQSKLYFFGNSKVWAEKKNPDFDFSSCRQVSLNQKRDYVDAVVDDDGDCEYICREDVEMVMRSLGLFCNLQGEKLKERLSSDELSGLFEEKEPSLEEVKEAFYVFDENRDGFIDAKELQRVLCILGLREGSQLEDCKRMISTFDENGDGRIDFNEFVKFMESSFC